jgi:hypothetical protein
MAEEVEIDMVEVLDVAARSIIEDAGYDWDEIDDLVKFNLKEYLVVPLDAALKEIIRQLKKEPIISTVNDINGNLNPDCKGGKHQACSGTAWDETVDALVLCDCVCHAPKED